MSHLPFHQEQLNFMIHLAKGRPVWLNPFFLFLDLFDTPYFFFVLIPIIWVGYSYRWGLRIVYWATLNNFSLALAKFAFGFPRPSTDMPEVGLLHPKSNGFPSGGAMGSMFLGALLIYYWRTPIAWILGTFYILLISFSRLYLGVHYPLDILGGWVLALISFTLFINAIGPIERFLVRIGLRFSFLLSIAIPILPALIYPKTQYAVGALLGIGTGTYFSLKNHLFLPDATQITEGIKRSSIGIVLIFLMVLLFHDKTTFVTSFTIAFIMSFGASPVCRWILHKK